MKREMSPFARELFDCFADMSRAQAQYSGHMIDGLIEQVAEKGCAHESELTIERDSLREQVKQLREALQHFVDLSNTMRNLYVPNPSGEWLCKSGVYRRAMELLARKEEGEQ